jgi:hypothetical protein
VQHPTLHKHPAIGIGKKQSSILCQGAKNFNNHYYENTKSNNNKRKKQQHKMLPELQTQKILEWYGMVYYYTRKT